MIYFDKKSGGFYDDKIHASIPAGAVEITETDHRKLLDEQGQGREIKVRAGKVMTEPPVPVVKTGAEKDIEANKRATSVTKSQGALIEAILKVVAPGKTLADVEAELEKNIRRDL